MGNPVLAVEGLRIQRGEIVILDDLSWRVEPGQHWAILGPNGSGKTSLLKALSGYFMPTAGAITVLGGIYGRTDWRDLRLRIGLVSSFIRQMIEEGEPSLNAVISGKYAMVNLWGKVTAGDRRLALRILGQVECAPLAARPWQYLSQGERQRVLIGRALMAKPRLLILDEPCAGLDPLAREHFLRFLERLGSRKGAPTLVLVAHHVEEIMPVFSHVLILKEGRVLAAGKKNETLTSRLLSEAFGARMTVRRSGGRFTLSVRSRKSAIA